MLDQTEFVNRVNEFIRINTLDGNQIVYGMMKQGMQSSVDSLKSGFAAPLWRISVAFSVISNLLVLPISASAQQTNTNSINAGQIEKRIERQKTAPEPKAVDIAPGKSVSQSVDELEGFILSAVNVTGATVYEVRDFARLYEDFLGRRISNVEIEKILARITEKYRKDGYFLSTALAPAQDLSFGILNIQVIEGYIDRVDFKGEKPGRPGFFRDWAQKITRSSPAKLAEIERVILLISDLPGISATPSVEEMPNNPGAYIMTITIAHDRFDAFTGLDNRGTNAVGPLQLSASAGANSTLGLFERLKVSTFLIPDSPEELLFGEFYSQIPVTSGGLQAFVSVYSSKVEAFSASRGSLLQWRGRKFTVGAWYPFIRQNDLALYLNTRFDLQNGRQSAINDNYVDRTRVARAGLRLWFRDGAEGSNSVEITYSRGLNIFGASKTGRNASRFNGTSRFQKLNLDLNRVQKITDDFWAELNVSGQTSGSTLLSSEEFGIGGSRYGRGYDPSEISDSRGVGASLEMRHRAPVQEGYLSKLWGYGFYDGGAVWRRGGNRDSLVSAGAGLRFFPWDGVRLSLEWAKPLTRPVFEEGSNGSRVFFSLGVDY